MDPFGRWPNLAAMMLGLGEERAGRPMLRCWRDGSWQTLNWGDFAQRVANVASGLAPYLQPGVPVLLVGESRPELVIANVALQLNLALPMPGYTTNLPADHAHLLRDSGARVAIVSTAALARLVLQGAQLASGLDVLVCMQPFEPDGAPAGLVVLDWDRLLAVPASLAEARHQADTIEREALACLIYTSGTGGAPKGVMLPHRAILSNCQGAAEVVAPLHLGEETYLSILPLSHTYEYTVGQYFLSAVGCEVVFARGIDTLASDMRAIRPTIMTVVPRVLDVIRGRVLAEIGRATPVRRRLFHRALAIGLRRLDGTLTLGDRLLDPLLDRLVRRRLRARFGGRLVALVSGGARLDPEVGRFFLAMSLRVMQGYGQTEAGPVVSVNPAFAIRVDTVGPPLRGVELRIAEDGEILVRGDLVMQGYWNRPEETAAAITDGWLHTGDVGVIVDGYLKITDRKKDIIVLSGGENISPARIEGLLMAEPEIAQAVVSGDGKIGLAAMLVTADGADAASVAAAVQRVNRLLPGIEKLRRHRIVDSFTLENGLLTPTQKIRRQLVLARYDAP